jgi:four helix bundle protein
MATIKRFEDLECWQAARKLTKYVYDLTKKEKFSRDFELVRQIRKSSVSSMGNTAEGFHRNSNKDFMRFLDYSRSSIAETVSHSYVAYDQEYIDDNELEEVKRLADEAWKKINNFISYLNKSSKTNRTNSTNSTN